MSSGARVLVVDDNVAFCENIVDILELQGYSATGVHDGVRALEVVQADRFDLILMDIRMPVLNGVQVFEKLKGMGQRIPVVLMTAYSVAELVEEALREGGFGVLPKPLRLEELPWIVESALADDPLIMVVDDNQELCATMCDVLGEQGYRVRVAEDGARAVALAMEADFDAILLDMRLPVLNGLEAHLAIQRIRPGVATILITGHSVEVEDLVRQAMAGKAFACLEKPLDMQHLLGLLRRAVGTRARRTRSENGD